MATQPKRITDEQKRLEAKFLAKLWRDKDFRAYFKANPAKALTEAKIAVPRGVRLKVVEDAADEYNIVIPFRYGRASDNPLCPDDEPYCLTRRPEYCRLGPPAGTVKKKPKPKRKKKSK